MPNAPSRDSDTCLTPHAKNFGIPAPDDPLAAFLTLFLPFFHSRSQRIPDMNSSTPASQETSIAPIEIFRAGTHTAMSGIPTTITPNMLQHCVASYDPVKHEAPLVIGHPKLDDPAYGWVEKLSVVGDSLMATVKDVDPEFAELVRQRRYSKISASFIPPAAASNPVPGVLYLKHVGFLGAVAPAVKGMKPVKFAGNDADTLTFGDPSVEVIQTHYEKLLRERDERDNAAFVGKMISEGRTLPVLGDGMIAFMNELSNEESIEFAEHKENRSLGLLEWFRQYVSRMPPAVPMGKSNFRETDPFRTDGPEFASGDFRVAGGYSVNREGLDLHARIEAYAREHSLSFAEAARVVAKR